MDNKLIVLIITSLTIIIVQGLPNPETKTPITVVNDERVHPRSDGSFSYNVTLSDGTQIQQSGSPNPPSSALNSTGTTGISATGPSKDDNAPSLVIRGEYTYIDPAGKTHKVTYVADKNGFQPQGDDIPVMHVGTSNLFDDKKMPSNNMTKAEEPLKTISSSLFSSPSGSL